MRGSGGGDGDRLAVYEVVAVSMNDARERAERILAGFDRETRREIVAIAAEETVSEVKIKAQAFLAGLDANDREKLKQLGMAAFEQYVTELPGPNEFIKGKIRPSVETAIDNLIADWCS